MGYLACMEETKNTHKMLPENLKGRYHFSGIGIDGNITLKWIRKNWVMKV
jgi:hypothetical protein